MLCLGIEGTAHSVGAAVVSDEKGRARVLSNIIQMYRPEDGGIHPREAANHHAENVVPVIQTAISEAKVGPSELELVAFSQGPGLGPCLRTVATAARALAIKLGIPIIGVNHCIAHLEIGRATTGATDPVMLYVSGGNTQVITFFEKRYRVLGETLDIGLGNLLDKFGREYGLPFPAGPALEKKAASGTQLLDMPYSVKGMDVSFSGILTAAEHLVTKGARMEDVCFTIQEVTFAMLTEVTERAMAYTKKSEVLLGGGVAQNSRLKQMVDTMARERGGLSFVPEGKLLQDNGAMIAWTGIIMHKAGVRMAVKDTVIDQRFRTDDVEVSWR
jgi:N6-L-threonylcarbamoyladenine synthase/N6-L-threonylcarbamoyladenine synthase/protein kinase Bud32